MTAAYSYIRMSTTVQLQGDSLRRQRKLAEDYAASHNLTLNADFRLEDVGLSAFDGENIRKGTLGQFLAAAESGKIAKGSFLLVESLDRLSRENIRIAFSQFLSILNSGITIVTLFDNHIYKPDSDDQLDMFSSLNVMLRAHEESLTKSKRLRSVWAEKRRNAAHKKMTARAPAWLRLADDRRSFDLIEERVIIVKRIFNECLAGIGAYTIAKRLNEERITCFGRSSYWQPSYIKKILSNGAVTGKLSLVNSDTKEIKDIENYYPKIITNDVFYNAMYVREGRKVGGGGRKGDKVSNLFSKVAFCGHCGSRMHHINKGGGERYLVCDAYRRGIDEIALSWRYEDFETSFLSFISEVNLPSYFTADSEQSQIKTVMDALAVAESRLSEQVIRRDNIFELYASGYKSDFAKSQLGHCDKMIDSIRCDIEQLKSKRDDLLAEPERLGACLDTIMRLIEKMKDPSTKGIYMLRSSVSQGIKSLIKSVDLFTHGALRHFVVTFKNNNIVTVFLDSKNPKEFLLYQGRRLLLGEKFRANVWNCSIPDGEHVEVKTDSGSIASFVDGTVIR